ncbi:GAF domain-containing protein [Amycolatopsis marina]|uniref:GAF domain-containing protein n=1 Tax=Amycolatopsis marina TaxID=490629 RepID=A0A1I0Y1L4_9PSEU|nr:GAF and ANTAR domain-containing protein [Amycolatopsis marina]SFB06510.1 GAF domain-containing protein [Amycolatopsis marina]
MADRQDSTERQPFTHLDEVAGALEALSGDLDREQELGVLLQRVCEQVVRAVPDADLAGVMMSRDGVPETVAITDERVHDIDDAQYQAGEGPCLRAMGTGELVRSSAEEARERWPDFARALAEAHVGSFLSAPLVIDSQFSGALNLFGLQPHGFQELEARILEIYAIAVETALRSTWRYLQARTKVSQLEQALTSRAVIDQAKGILMAARGLTANEAFQELVKQSQRENVKLRDFAEEFVAKVTGQKN